MLEAVLRADVVVYASPVYVWDFSAQMKALIDRHYCFVKWQVGDEPQHLLEGKPTLLLATCGGGAEDNGDLIQEVFAREMAYLHCRIVGQYIVPDCTLPSALGAIAQQTAWRMTDDLLAACGP